MRISLRDCFAIHILNALLIHREPVLKGSSTITQRAYELADAMLETRKEKKQ